MVFGGGAEIDFHDAKNGLQLINFSTYPIEAIACLLANMPNKGPGNLPFLPPHVLGEGPHGQTDWSRLLGVENTALPQCWGFRETPYMSTLGAAIFDQMFWECIQNTSVQDFIHQGSSNRAKHGFVSFILDKAGCGRLCQQNRWLDWNYFQYDSDGQSIGACLRRSTATSSLWRRLYYDCIAFHLVELCVRVPSLAARPWALLCAINTLTQSSVLTFALVAPSTVAFFAIELTLSVSLTRCSATYIEVSPYIFSLIQHYGLACFLRHMLW
jgi:hypothetical protein